MALHLSAKARSQRPGSAEVATVARFALVLFAGLVACASARAVPTPVPDRSTVAAEVAVTVKVVRTCDGQPASGSGVILQTGWVATAHHVVAGQGNCVITVDGAPAVVVKLDEEHDVAILAVWTVTLSPLCRCTDAWEGMPITTVGFPFQSIAGESGFQVSRGYLISKAGGLYRTSSSAWFGSSGGPLFDEDGCLVGLLVSVFTSFGSPVDDHYFATPAEHVWRLLAEVDKELLSP